MSQEKQEARGVEPGSGFSHHVLQDLDLLQLSLILVCCRLEMFAGLSSMGLALAFRVSQLCWNEATDTRRPIHPCKEPGAMAFVPTLGK